MTDTETTTTQHVNVKQFNDSMRGFLNHTNKFFAVSHQHSVHLFLDWLHEHASTDVYQSALEHSESFLKESVKEVIPKTTRRKRDKNSPSKPPSIYNNFVSILTAHLKENSSEVYNNNNGRITHISKLWPVFQESTDIESLKSLPVGDERYTALSTSVQSWLSTIDPSLIVPTTEPVTDSPTEPVTESTEPVTEQKPTKSRASRPKAAGRKPKVVKD